MFKLRKLIIILLLTASIKLFFNFGDQWTANHKFGAILTIQFALTDYDLFKKLTRFYPPVWYNYFYSKIEPYLDEGREFHLFDFIKQRRRRRELKNVLRVIRFNMRFAGFATFTLQLIFGQSRWTIEKDIDFIMEIVVVRLYFENIHLAIPGTAEYAQWLGGGVFSAYFRTSIYALDIMKVKIKCPIHNQRDYYDGHHKQHDVGIGVICNGWGSPCLLSRPKPGRISDQRIWNEMKNHSNILQLILPDHFILCDRIFRFHEPPLLTAFTGYDVLLLFMLYFNYFQSSARIIIENLFGRVKCYFPIFFYFRYSLEKIELYLQCAFIMTAILIKHQEPLRATD